MSHWNKHPGVRTGSDLTRAERIVDAAVHGMGSLKFLAGQTIFVTAWIVVNLVAVFGCRFDPYPFILLNLLFSTQAAYATPLILLAQGRGDVRNAEVAMHTMQTSDETKAGVEYLIRRLEDSILTPEQIQRLMHP